MTKGISGDEGAVRELIINEIKNFAEYETDNLGNLIVHKKGISPAKRRVMISAHMDEVGFIVTDITADGLIKFDEVGGIDRRVLPGRSVLINGKVNGVIGVKPIHLCSSDECEAIPKLSSMYIDIGAENREEAQSAVSLGDSVTFDALYDENGFTLRSKSIDDRIGCYMMIEMIKSELPYDLTFTFVVQEEVGLHGSKVAAYTVNPDFAIVLEATTAADVPLVAANKQVCNASKGAVIGYMDRRTIYDKGMIAAARRLAEENSIKIQFKRAIAGGNDAGSIHQSRGGVRTLAISLPCRYLHAQLSQIAKSDIDDVYNLARLLAQKAAGGEL